MQLQREDIERSEGIAPVVGMTIHRNAMRTHRWTRDKHVTVLMMASSISSPMAGHDDIGRTARIQN